MHISTVPYRPGTLKQPLSSAELEAICSRVFGSRRAVTAAEELPGGTINTVYRLHRDDRPPLVLRVAPSEQHPELFRHEHRLLRREFSIQPYLAPVGQLLPDIAFVDFTEQLIARDYMVQTFIAGDVWRDVDRTLAPTEQAALWRQFGAITRQIHMVEQATFGSPFAAHGSQRWSDTLLADFDELLLDFDAWELDTQPITTVHAFVSEQRPWFDFQSAAHLMHGDLWLNNMLIRRSATGAQIVGVLDAGFAQWGDPAADWTLMRMRETPPLDSTTFWEGYGSVAADANTELRAVVYQARMLGWALLELKRRHDPKTMQLLRKLVTLTEQLNHPT